MDNKNYNFIKDRISFISELVTKSNVESIINYNKEDELLENTYKSEDVRELMPKKFMDFSSAINK